MKKTLLLGLTLFGFIGLKAQDGADKKFRFGLKLTPSINWYKIDDEKSFKKGGSVAKFGYGLIMEFTLTEVAAFSTGFQIDYDGGKVDMKDTVGYFYNENDGFAEVDDIDYADTNTYTKYTAYKLNKRQYNSMYLTIPLQIKLRTKEIGYLTYFGNIGLLTSIHLKTKSKDNVTSYDISGNAVTNDVDKLDISKDMNILKTGLALGGGLEINLSGSTSVLIGVQFTQGFMNVVKKESKFLIDGEKTSAGTTTKPIAQEQKFLGQNFALTLGILF